MAKAKDEQKLRREIIKMMGGKRLQQVGGSRAVLVPKMWASVNAIQIDGDEYIRVQIMNAGIIQLSPLNKEEIDGMLKGAV